MAALVASVTGGNSSPGCQSSDKSSRRDEEQYEYMVVGCQAEVEGPDGQGMRGLIVR